MDRGGGFDYKTLNQTMILFPNTDLGTLSQTLIVL